MGIDDLTGDQRGKLREYVAMLDRWRKVTDLISEHGFARIWERHIADSLFLYGVRPAASRWLDFGSGTGLPAVVLGALLADRASAQIDCVESDGRKCAFLRAVADSLQIPLKIHNKRAETVSFAEVGPVEVVTARAFSSIKKILALAAPQIHAGAAVILPRGKTYVSEIDQIDLERYSLSIDPGPGADGEAVLTIIERPRSL